MRALIEGGADECQRPAREIRATALPCMCNVYQTDRHTACVGAGRHHVWMDGADLFLTRASSSTGVLACMRSVAAAEPWALGRGVIVYIHDMFERIQQLG